MLIRAHTATTCTQSDSSCEISGNFLCAAAEQETNETKQKYPSFTSYMRICKTRHLTLLPRARIVPPSRSGSSGTPYNPLAQYDLVRQSKVSITSTAPPTTSAYRRDKTSHPPTSHLPPPTRPPPPSLPPVPSPPQTAAAATPAQRTVPNLSRPVSRSNTSLPARVFLLLRERVLALCLSAAWLCQAPLLPSWWRGRGAGGGGKIVMFSLRERLASWD